MEDDLGLGEFKFRQDQWWYLSISGVQNSFWTEFYNPKRVLDSCQL